MATDTPTEADGDQHAFALSPKTRVLDRFRVEKILGVGGFGITYLARDERLDVPVAIKEYCPGHLSVERTDAGRLEPRSSQAADDFQFGLDRFLKEARTLAQFEEVRPIVRVRDFFETNGTGYLVMNYYDGQTLSAYLGAQQGTLPEDEAVSIIRRVLEGLGDVHAGGVLHRDIDPTNIYLTDSGRVVLLDFGAARVAVGERTQTLSVVLKQGYAPHEQYHRRGDQGPWTDVYACAATLYKMLTGYKPPEAPARVMDDELVPPEVLAPSVSETTNEAILRGLAIRPDDRHPSSDAFLDALPNPEPDAEAGWTTPNTTEMSHADDGTAPIEVSATAPCRVYVDEELAFILEDEASETVHVDPGGHHIRATRIDSGASDEVTTAVASTRSDAPTEDDRSTHMPVGALVWEDTVFATVVSSTTVTVNFGASEEVSGLDALEDEAGAEPETTSAPDSRTTEAPPFGEANEPDENAEDDGAPIEQTSGNESSDWDHFLEEESSTALPGETDVPDDEPIWEQGAPGPDEQRTESSGDATGEDDLDEAVVDVVAVQACELSVDGKTVAQLSADDTQTLRLRPGSHTIRALRTDANSPAEEDSTGPGGPDALGDIVWTNTVFASALDRKEVVVDFTEREA